MPARFTVCGPASSRIAAGFRNRVQRGRIVDRGHVHRERARERVGAATGVGDRHRNDRGSARVRDRHVAQRPGRVRARIGDRRIRNEARVVRQRRHCQRLRFATACATRSPSSRPGRRPARRLPRRAEADLRARDPRRRPPPFLYVGDLARLLPTMLRSARCCRCTASSRASSITHGCARRSRSTRCSSAATRTGCRPSTAALVYLQVLDGGWYADGGVYSLVEAIARRSTSAAASGRGDRAGQRAGDGRAARGRRADRRRRGDLQRRRAARPRAPRPPRTGPPRWCRRCRASCSTSARTGFAEAAAPHAAGRDRLPRLHPHVTRGGALPRTYSTYLHAPSRTEPAMAANGGDSLACCCRCPTCAAAIDWAREADGLRDALVADLETTFGLDGLDASVAREHRMTPVDFASELGAVRRQRVRDRADAAPVGLLPPPQPRPARGGAVPRRRRDPSRGRDPRRAAGRRGDRRLVWPTTRAPRPSRARRRRHDGVAVPAVLHEARDTTRRVARTFALACRLLPRPLRDDVYLLYLVFRTLDDLVD